jgi:hypothetical protein
VRLQRTSVANLNEAAGETGLAGLVCQHQIKAADGVGGVEPGQLDVTPAPFSV